MSTLSAQPYKGTRDFYPEEKRIQNYIFAGWKRIAKRYGYEEYGTPMVEPLEVYAAKSGQEIVSEQTYSFTDRGDRVVAIRPEMTPSISRMVAAPVARNAHILLGCLVLRTLCATSVHSEDASESFGS